MPEGPTSPPTYKVCSVDGCERPARKRNRFCAMHERRFTIHGDPTIVAPGSAPGTEFPLAAGSIPCECGGKTTVKDSRPTTIGVRRRRKCLVCHTRFTTIEVRAQEEEEALALMDGSRKLSVVRRLESLETVLTSMLDELQRTAP